jgi:signal transduction histidine kinase
VTTLTKARSESQRERLDRLTAEVAALRQQLHAAQRLATVGTMTAMVSHELNNILTPIISYAQLARKNPSLADKAIARAAEGGQRATRICKAILGVSSESSGELTEENVSELVAEILSAMARDPAKDSITLNLLVPPDLTVRTRRAELQQVLLNLVINARESVLAKPLPRQIDIAAFRDDDRIHLTVADSGVGIAEENMEHIFQPFFTTKDGENGVTRGHGLGLAFCQQVVSSLDGEILVESKLGEGACFSVRLPL